jgi:outer membrane lipoprotein SlyB
MIPRCNLIRCGQHPSRGVKMMPRKSAFSLLGVVLLSLTLGGALPAAAQSRHDRNNFYQGANRGVHGGNYGYDRDRHYRNDNQGGIGPGKGALIGGAAGGVLGAVFGGGVKGSLITGAAGAGVGAIIGGVAQNNRDNNNNYYRH